MPQESDLKMEEGLLTFIRDSASKDARIRNNPDKVLGLFEEYILKTKMIMNVGKARGDVVVKLMRESKPKYMIELGCFMGYSAIKFSKELVGADAKYVSFEINPDFANIARQIIDIAGLGNVVEIIVGPAFQTLVPFADDLEKHGIKGSIDFFFIDHWKDLYLNDFRLLESLCVISEGSTIVADNVSKKDTIPYVNYVQASPQERRDMIKYIDTPYAKIYSGRWNILYKSETINIKDSETGYEDGLEITKCIEILNS